LLLNYETNQKLTSAISGLFVPVAALVGVDDSHHGKKRSNVIRRIKNQPVSQAVLGWPHFPATVNPP
tara:strand:+ start:1434 stop:1634 length:201 start_codon:yes stop_codon:yes gene_type:complete